MKKLILVLLISSSAFGQLEVKKADNPITLGKVENGTTYVADLHYRIRDNGDTSCTLMFQNAKYTTISDIQYFSFMNKEGTLNQCYTLLKTCISDENKKNKDYSVNFTLGKTNVIASPAKLGFNYSIMIWTDKGYFYVTEKQLDQLFGKVKS